MLSPSLLPRASWYTRRALSIDPKDRCNFWSFSGHLFRAGKPAGRKLQYTVYQKICSLKMGLPKHYGTNWTYYNNDTINNNCHRLVQDGIPSPGTPCIHAFYTTHNQCKLIESTTPPSRNISWLSSSFPSNEIDLKKNLFTKRWGTFMNFRDALQQNDGNYLGAFQELGTRKIPTNCLIPAGNHQSSRSKNFETPV